MRSRHAPAYARAVRSTRSRSRPARAARVVLAVVAAALFGAAVLAVLPSARAASDGTYEDSFPSSGSFSGNTGTLSWSGPWIEIGESDGAGSGLVTVAGWTSRCTSQYCLRIDDQQPGTSLGAQRSADLSGAASAVLTFSYALEQDNPGGTSFDLEVSPTDSGPWTTLATYVVSGNVNAPYPQAFDLTPYVGADTTIRVTSGDDNHSDEFYLDDVRIEAVPAARRNPSLWFSIRDNTTTGPSGITSLADGAIAVFGPPGVNYQPGQTTGTLSTLVDWDALFGAVDINGLHLVMTDLTIGGVTVEAGDLLFTLRSDATLTGSNGPLAYKLGDVGRFRPSTPGDYTAGAFSILLDQPLGVELRGMTLVEKPTAVGEVTLSAGSFLFTRAGGAEHSDVYRYVVSSAGPGSTSGTVTKLIEGTEIGFADQVWGLDLVEDGMGWPFPRGAIVMTVEKDVLAGLDGTAVPKRTLMSLVVARTSLSATARAVAVIAWDGNDLGLNEDKERLDGFTFADLDFPPAFDQDLGDRTDAEGTSVSISVSATDPLGESITYSASGLPVGVTMDTGTGLISGTISYTAASSSPYSVALTVTDASSNTDVDTFVWTVTNVNRTPTVTTPGDQANAEGDAVAVAVAGSDPDEDNLTWTAGGLPDGLSIASGTGVISGTVAYTASPGSPYAVTVRATDNGSPNLYVEVAFTWTVTNTNRAPMVTGPGNQSDAEGAAVSLAIVGSDPDGDTLTWTATGLPAGLTIGPSSGLISGTLQYDAAAGSPYSVTVRATDDGTPNTYTDVAFTWSVTNANRSPVVTGPGDRSNSEADVVAFTVAGSDPDGDILTWTATGLPPGLSIASGTGVISGTVEYDAAGSSPYTVTVRVTDDGSPNLYDESAFVWTVTNTNRAPAFQAGPSNRTDPEATVVSLTATATDPDGDAVTYSATGLPPGIAVDPTTGAIVGTIDYSASAGSPYAVTIHAEDPGGLFAETGFTWTVTDVPVALEISKVSDATGPVRPGDALAYTITVTNTSSVIHRDVAIGDPVPAGTTYFPGWSDVTRAAAAADTFETGDYAGSAGSIAWGGPWQESGDNGSSTGGVAVVEADAHCREAACLRLGGDGVVLDGVAVTRAVDLGAASAPRLGLAYHRLLLGTPGGSVAVQARGGGSGWVTLATIDLGATSGWSTLDLDLSAVAASDTEIRLLGSGAGVESVVSVDDVRVVTGAVVSLPGSAPPTLLAGVDLWPGEVLEVGYLVVLDDPIAETQVTNTATATSTQLTGGAADAAVDFIDQPPAFAVAPPDRGDAEGDVVAFAVDADDPEGGAVTYTASGFPAGIGIDPASGVISGAIDYAASVSSPYPVVITATDAVGLTNTAGFQWTVADTNRAPEVTNPGSLGAAEGDPVTLAMNASDPDGDTLTWTATGFPAGLSIAPGTGVISGTVSYTASAGSPYSVTVRATDDGSPNRFGEASFTWAITNTNRAPTVTSPGAQSGAEGQVVNLTVAGSDPDGDTLTWSATGLPAGLSIAPSTGVMSGTIVYTASAGSPYSVTVRATDNGSPSRYDEKSLTWTVANTNRPPVVANPGAKSSAEGASVSMPVSGSDPDGNTLAWSATGLPPGLSISPSTGVVSGSISYMASPASPYDVTIRATDDGAPTLYTGVSFSWTVDDTNRPPVLVNPGAQSDAEGQAVTLPISGSDPDGDSLTWSATGLPSSLAIDPASGLIGGSLGFTSAGTTTITVRAADGGAPSLFTEMSFSWTVEDTNRAPTLQNPGSQTDAEGDAVSLQVAALDPDGDGLTFAASGLPPGLSVSSATGAITGSLGYALGDRYAVVITTTDDGSPALSSNVSFQWVIGDTNRPPTLAAPGNRSNEVGESASVSPIASDPDGDALNWSASGLPAGMSISPITGQISGSATAPGVFTVTLTVTDDGTPPLATKQTFTWTIVSPPGFPVVEAVSTQTNVVGDRVSLGIRATHPDGLEITYEASGLPDGLTIGATTGRISGTIATAGSSFVIVTVTDSRGQQTKAGFLWEVEPLVDEAPLVSDDSVSLAADTIPEGGVVLDAAGNDHDPEGEPLTITSAGPAEVGEVSLVDGLVVFTPAEGWIGTVTFPYAVADPEGNTSAGTITITVEEPLADQLGTRALAIDPATPSSPSLTELGRLNASAGTEVLLGTVFQSLYVLRVPLALLGGAVFWSLFLGGLLNLGFVFKGGMPRLVRRTSRAVAVVMAPHGGKVDVLTAPGHGQVLSRLLATDRGLEAGRLVTEQGEVWVEVTLADGRGWVPAHNLTEEVDRSWFADDPEPPAIVREFVSRLRSRQDFSDLVSRHGLFVSHHSPLVHFSVDILPAVMDDPVAHLWKGRNPAYADFTGTFDLAIATSVLDAFDHPYRELLHDATAVPSTVVPVEFTNFHWIAIGADVHGPERLDQSAWLVVFSYEDALPKIIGLVKEG